MQRAGAGFAGQGNKCKEFRVKMSLVCFRIRNETRVCEDEIRLEGQARSRLWTL